jgi:enediyne biosynthesis protein E4
VDGNGALSFVYANQWEDSVYIHNECSKCGAFIGLHLLRTHEAGAPLTTVTSGHPIGARLPPAIGATILVTTPDGHKFTSQVDGGNGHSGRRSQDVHIGLGELPIGALLQVEISWRTFTGERRSTKLQLRTGWSTIVLG